MIPQTNTTAGKCPYHHHAAEEIQAASNEHHQALAKSDTDVLQEMETWMARTLPCVAGRREYNRGRYMIRVATKETVPAIFEEFKEKLATGEVVACLYVFNDPDFYDGQADTGDAFKFLAEQMSPISSLPAHDLAHGAPLTNSIDLRCPVTNRKTTFDDFECIAFCPQSNDKDDPLYDPLMAMPYPAVNMSSDVFAFSRFVNDSAQNAWGKSVHEEPDIGKVEKLFDLCIDRWQRVAAVTIRNYEALTDTDICPVHVTADEEYWIAGHKDPAFAEQVKESHKHELPVLYGRRIARGWLRFFKGDNEYVATGLARDGIPV